MSEGTVIGEVAAGLLINTVHTVQEGHNPFGTLVAGGVFLGGLVFVSEFVNERLAVTLGALYLLASFLFHGQVFINMLTNLSGTAQPTASTPGKSGTVNA